MPTSSTDVILSALEALQKSTENRFDELEKSNGDMKKSLEGLRDSLPVTYIPRPENERVINAIQTTLDKHDGLLRELQNTRYQEMQQRYEGQGRLAHDISQVRYVDTQAQGMLARHFYGILLSGLTGILMIVAGFVINSLAH